MSLRVVLEPAAQQDLADASTWYQDHSPPTIVEEFLTSISDTLDCIEASPQQFREERGDVRKAVVPHFPYVILFVPLAEVVAVIAVFHTSRDPAIWMGRADR